MAEINAKMVGELRAKTGAGLMDCKKALVESEGNQEEAIKWLRSKGLSAAAKKAGRVAAEGLASISINSSSAVLVELNSETDFVGRNDLFQALISEITELAHQNSDIESLKNAVTKSGRNVEEEIIDRVATIGENISLRRVVQKSSTPNTCFAGYVHNEVKTNLGKIAVLIELKCSSSPTPEVEELAKKIAMHVAAAKPEFLHSQEVSQSKIDAESELARKEALDKGKPEAVVEKMVEGRIRKFHQEIVLLEQFFVMDNKIQIKDLVADLAKKVGFAIELASFERFEVGEGIEQDKADFAAEVAAVAK